MSDDDPPHKIIAMAILVAQSIPIASGSYGGLSGHDSLWRSMCTLVDQSVGLLLFYGLFNLTWFTKSTKLSLARINIIHTTRPGPSLRATLVSYRARRQDIGNMTSRSGRFEIVWSNGGLPDGQDIEAHFPDPRIAPNSNHWIYPYLLGQQPYEENSNDVAMLTLSRKGLIRTAALAISRFTIFLGFSAMITLFHILIIALLFEDRLTKTFLILADIGRWILVVGQLSSVLTYSLDYKGVCSWASPFAYGTTWSKTEQDFCRSEVLRYTGRFYHARIVFYVCEYFWPKIARRLERWKYFWGESVFSAFKCFDNDVFEEDQCTLLRLHVDSRGPGDLSNDFVKGYAVDFKLPTVMVQLCFQNRLIAGYQQRMWNFWVLLPFCLCSIVTPFLVVFRDGGPKTPALIIMGIIQIITAVLAYKDVDNWSINCKFELDPSVPASSSAF
ncbi:hypothetical protein VKT23_016065 [Stygiomarasmius scandens]|uniref:Integral membrane protein n=1 Tax=Marasmiellus scandens TaxID=2682957 RepID=A0ABR1IX88_9AGAR